MFVAITGITSTDVKLISALVTACIVIYFKFKTQEIEEMTERVAKLLD